MRRFLTIVLFFACLSASACGQESRPGDDADRILDALDAKLYSPLRSGLKELEYDYAVTPEGVFSTKLRIGVRWSADSRPTVRWSDIERRSLKDMPEWLKAPAGGPTSGSVKDVFEAGARATTRWFVPESPKSKYAAWRKRLETRLVNARLERVLVFEPATPGPLKRIETAVDAKGLPWRVTYFPSKPVEGVETVVEEPVFEEIDGKWVKTSWKETSGVSSIQHVLTYQLVRGWLLPSAHERLAPGGKAPDRTVFDAVTPKPPPN